MTLAFFRISSPELPRRSGRDPVSITRVDLALAQPLTQRLRVHSHRPATVLIASYLQAQPSLCQ